MRQRGAGTVACRSLADASGDRCERLDGRTAKHNPCLSQCTACNRLEFPSLDSVGSCYRSRAATGITILRSERMMFSAGFVLSLSVNSLWIAAVGLAAVGSAPSIEKLPPPVAVLSAVSAAPEECPWDIPAVRTKPARQQAGQESRLACRHEISRGLDASAVDSPRYWDLDADPLDETGWEQIYRVDGLGRWGRKSAIVPPTPWRPGATPSTERAEFALVEVGRRPVWLPVAHHARPMATAHLFEYPPEGISSEIRCHRAVAQHTRGYLRAVMTVWLAASDGEE